MPCVQRITAEDLCGSFIGWQCRIRQIAMRSEGGRPSTGMQPCVTDTQGTDILARMTVLMNQKNPRESLDFFRHQVLKTHDPNLVRERGLAYLQSSYYQGADLFSDKLTALFYEPSEVANLLCTSGECVLEFAQYSQSYELVCKIRPLPEDDLSFQSTLWHNRIFNPHMPPEICVLEFSPQWQLSKAEPPP